MTHTFTRRLAVLLTAFASLTAGAAHAAESKPPANTILLDLGLHVIGAGYQRVVSDRVALSVTGGLYDPWTTTDEVGDIRGGYLRIRPYVFLIGTAPRGLWLSPFVQAAMVSAKTAEGAKSGGAFAFGAAAGYAFLFGDWLHLSLGLGGQYHHAEVATEVASPAFHGFHWHLDATIGIAF